MFFWIAEPGADGEVSVATVLPYHFDPSRCLFVSSFLDLFLSFCWWQIREKMERFRSPAQSAPSGLNPSTYRLMSRYLQQSDTLIKKGGNINHRSKVIKDGKVCESVYFGYHMLCCSFWSE